MADPITASIGLLGMGMSAFGGLTAAQGAGYSGAAQAAQANYQAAIAQMNSRLASADAEYTLQAGFEKEQIAGLKTREAIGALTTGMAAGNINPTLGSAKNVIASQQAIGAMDVETIRANTLKTAYGFRVTAAEDTAQGGLYSMVAQTAPVAAGYAATASLLGAGGQISSQYLTGQQKGIFPGGTSVAPQWYGSSDPSLGMTVGV